MEIPDSKLQVKLFRRFPDDNSIPTKEADYGPGYIKLYERLPSEDDGDTKTRKRETSEAGIMVVFRSNGTMKVRAAHLVQVEEISCVEEAARAVGVVATTVEDDRNNGKSNESDEEKGRKGVRIEKSIFDVSYENEIRYVANSDTADMSNGLSKCYEKETPNHPIDFPLSFEFYDEDDRNRFIRILFERLNVVLNECDWIQEEKRRKETKQE